MFRMRFKGLAAGVVVLSVVLAFSMLAVQAHATTQKKPVPKTGTIVTPTPALVAKGKALAAAHGCQGCHTITGAKLTGPTWKGLAGSKVHLTSGKTVVATDSYLIGVITDPTTLMVEGYDATVMSEMISPGSISTAEAKALVAYIKTLKK